MKINLFLLSLVFVFVQNIKAQDVLTQEGYKNCIECLAKRFSPVKVENVTDESATIDVGNLINGQSGIITHMYENSKSIIVSNAYVVSSNTNSSTIKFIPFLGLKQDALPTSNRKVQNGDEFVINYLYSSSLLITPNATSHRLVRTAFKNHNFLHSDIFGAYLKIKEQPYPNKEIIQKFAIEENLGTIFVVIKQKAYVLDTNTFEILDIVDIRYSSNKEQVPFYTRVEDIKAGLFSFSFKNFETNDNEEKETPYNSYYKEILGLHND